MIPCETLQKLADDHWVLLENPFPDELLQFLKNEAQKSWDQGKFKAAKVGRSTEQQRAAEIRSDWTLWVDLNSEKMALLQAQINEIKNSLNQELYLGLQDFECHFARYAEGQFYDEHIDQPRLKSPLHGERVISFVLYLNQSWKPEDGGQLSLRHLSKEIQILPNWGQMVLFRSDTVPHAVLPAKRERWSLTGWFRRT